MIHDVKNSIYSIKSKENLLLIDHTLIQSVSTVEQLKANKFLEGGN